MYSKSAEKNKYDAYLSNSMQSNIAEIKKVMANNSDLIVRLSKAVNERDFTYASIYISELVSENSINNLSLSLIEINKNTDIALVRKRIKNINLKLENLSIGSISKTRVSMMYIENIAKE